MDVITLTIAIESDSLLNTKYHIIKYHISYYSTRFSSDNSHHTIILILNKCSDILRSIRLRNVSSMPRN